MAIKTNYDSFHDMQVADEFETTIENLDCHSAYEIKDSSLYIKKPVNTSSFEVGSIYIGTRICEYYETEYEELDWFENL